MNTSCNYCTKDTGTIQVFNIAILILFYCDVFHNFLISDNNKFSPSPCFAYKDHKTLHLLSVLVIIRSVNIIQRKYFWSCVS